MSRQLSGQKQCFRWWACLPLLLLLVAWAQASALMPAEAAMHTADMQASQLATQTATRKATRQTMAHCQSLPPMHAMTMHTTTQESPPMYAECSAGGDSCDMHCANIGGCHSWVSGWAASDAGLLSALTPPTSLDAAWQPGFYVSIIAPNLDRPPSLHV